MREIAIVFDAATPVKLQERLVSAVAKHCLKSPDTKVSVVCVVHDAEQDEPALLAEPSSTSSSVGLGVLTSIASMADSLIGNGVDLVATAVPELFVQVHSRLSLIKRALLEKAPTARCKLVIVKPEQLEEAVEDIETVLVPHDHDDAGVFAESIHSLCKAMLPDHEIITVTPSSSSSSSSSSSTRRKKQRRLAMSGSGSGSGSHAELEMLAPGVSLTTSLKSISSSSLSSVSNVNLAAIEAYGLCVEDTKATLPPADLVDIPPCAWYRRLSDHLPPLKEFVVSPTEAVRNIGLGLRLFRDNRSERHAGRDAIIDPFTPLKHLGPNMGVPGGGIGCGSVGRGWRGEFNRWQIRAGKASYRTVFGDQFSLCLLSEPGEPNRGSEELRRSSSKRSKANLTSEAKPLARVLHSGRPPSTDRYSQAIRRAWDWGYPAIQSDHVHYCALYPRAWTVYEEPVSDVRMTCCQISPIIPHEYQVSSYPVMVFRWVVEHLAPHSSNNSSHASSTTSTSTTFGTKDYHTHHPSPLSSSSPSAFSTTVSSKDTSSSSSSSSSSTTPSRPKKLRLMFTFQNSIGEKSELLGGHSNRAFTIQRPVSAMSKDKAEKKHKSRTSSRSNNLAAQASEALRRSDNGSTRSASPVSDLSDNSDLSSPSVRKVKHSRKSKTASTAHLGDGSSSASAPTLSTPIVGVELKHRLVQKCVASDGSESQFVDPISFAIATLDDSPGVKVSYNARFTVNSDESAASLWRDFRSEEGLRNQTNEAISKEGESIAAALAVEFEIDVGQTREIVFALAWDVPLARFGQGDSYARRYTRFYGKEGDAAPAIAADALLQWRSWDQQISSWQAPIVDDPMLPSFYKLGLLNETYYISAGGSIWLDDGPSDLKEQVPNTSLTPSVGRYLYLESLEYYMYNTYDVHWYASFALVMLWPLLELSVQRDFATATMQGVVESASSRFSAPILSAISDALDHEKDWRILSTGKKTYRKIKGCVPHDLGKPSEAPWYRVNSYNIQDISRWKDLNAKFVVSVYRDYVATKDEHFVRDVWPAIVAAMTYLRQFEGVGELKDMVLNEGFPDQTYDTWEVHGCSAYCGGIWIAALSAAAKMAEIVGDSKLRDEYTNSYESARQVYHRKLWNGKYYNYDSSNSPHHDSIMTDQMAGQWYAHACSLPPVVLDPDHARSALSTVYQYNVMQFVNGNLGAVNGMRPDGSLDKSCLQSSEVWTGTTYAAAAAMVQAGLVEEGLNTARGVIETTFNLGYAFQTPEAWDRFGRYRAIGYMRPLAIWALQWALQSLTELPPLSLSNDLSASSPAVLSTTHDNDS